MERTIELRGITKRFGSVTANNNINLTIRRGEVHALVGENGAGKSTLMNIIYGVVRPDEGSILVDGQEVDIRRSSDAIELGIGMVHQHMMQVPSYSILENVILGDEPRTKWGSIDRKIAEKRITDLSSRFGLEADLDTKVCDLPVGLKQRLEIIKLLYRGAEIIILDEPTAALSPQGTEELLDVIRDLKNEGKTIIFISHKLPEVLAISDRITVMRKGCVEATIDGKSAKEDDLVSLMIGHLPTDLSPERSNPGEVILDVKDLSVVGVDGSTSVKNACLQLHAGEIVALAGVEGNGQRELTGALIGVSPIKGGAISMCGRDITGLTVLERRQLGMAFVPEDRIESGLAISASISENAVFGLPYRKAPVARGKLIDWQAASDFADELTRKYRIKIGGPSRTTPVATLSGGNMQKLLVGRELSGNARCLVISQPTRGLDIGAKRFIYDAMFEKKHSECAVLVVSTDLDEIFEIADRILVMYKGRLVGDLLRDGTTPHEVGLYMTGAMAS